MTVEIRHSRNVQRTDWSTTMVAICPEFDEYSICTFCMIKRNSYRDSRVSNKNQF